MHVLHENIDQDEIDKFNQFAEQWWDQNGDNASLLKLNPLRFKYINNNSILTSVYLIAAAESPSTEPKLPWPSINVYLREKSCAILTIVS